MRPAPNILRRIGDQRGQTSVEYVLLLAFVGIPIIYVLRVLLSLLSSHYRMVSFLETFLFP